MKDKYYYTELFSYEDATEQQREDLGIDPNDYFDLRIYDYPPLQLEICCYVCHQSIWLPLNQLREEQFCIEILGAYFRDCWPGLDSIPDQNIIEIRHGLKQWANGKRFKKVQAKYEKRFHTQMPNIARMMDCLRNMYSFLVSIDDREEKEKDRWQLEKLNIDVRINPAQRSKSIAFVKIIQRPLREDVKQLASMWLKYLSINTIKSILAATNKFSGYLYEYHKDVKSMRQIDRSIIKSYLTYLGANDPNGRRKNHIQPLRTLFLELGRVYEDSGMENLILYTDIPSQPKCSFKVYSEEEQRTWANAVKYMDEQVGRAFMLHQVLGTRISDILTLQQDCMEERDGKWWIRIESVKAKTYRKPITREIRRLIQDSIFYTLKNFKLSTYVFVDRNDSSKPMSYSTIRYHLNKVIKEQDLRDRHGERFSAKTHIFRHVYGMKLTESHVSDQIIAELLGHSNTDSVHYYRRMGSKIMALETRKSRQRMDEILMNIVKDWEGYENL